MPIGIRRQARMIALQTLYEYDIVQHSPEEVLQRHIEDRHLQPKIVEYARELVLGVCGHLAEIDAHIQSAAQEWPFRAPERGPATRTGSARKLYRPARLAAPRRQIHSPHRFARGRHPESSRAQVHRPPAQRVLGS